MLSGAFLLLVATFFQSSDIYAATKTKSTTEKTETATKDTKKNTKDSKKKTTKKKTTKKTTKKKTTTKKSAGKTTKNNKKTNANQVYDPAFGWITPSDTIQDTIDSDGDLNKMVGDM